MASIMDELLGTLASGSGGSDAASLLGGLLGGNAEPTVVNAATKTGLEAILGGLAGNAKSEDGAAALLEALSTGHDGGILSNLGGLLGSSDSVADGSKILGHVFGDNKNMVQAKVADKSGLDMGLVLKLLPILAPVVMGMLGRKSRTGGLDAAGLAGMLGDESKGLDLGDFADLLGGDSSGVVSGLMDKVKDAITGE